MLCEPSGSQRRPCISCCGLNESLLETSLCFGRGHDQRIQKQPACQAKEFCLVPATKRFEQVDHHDRASLLKTGSEICASLVIAQSVTTRNSQMPIKLIGKGNIPRKTAPEKPRIDARP